MKRRPPSRVDVWGSAKVNIGWSVGPVRSDGYHDVAGLLQTISLRDRVRIDTTGDRTQDAGFVVDLDGASVRLVVPGVRELENGSNLVVRAAEVLGNRAAPLPTTVVVDKSIPVAAGLGGGSADAAATLVGLNAAWGAGLSARDLTDLARAIGSDVPAVLVGGLIAASGRGEHVRNVGGATSGVFVLGVSEETIATAHAYAKLDELRVGGQPEHHAELHHNDLEAAACALVEDLRPRLDAMRRAAGVAFVAGSGPTVVGVAADDAQARAIADHVREKFAHVIIAEPSSWGVRLSVGGKGAV